MKRKLDPSIKSLKQMSVGTWCSDHYLRSYFREIQKGIMEKAGKRTIRAIIVNFPAHKKRHHGYGDSVDLGRGRINYIGQGRLPGIDQKPVAGNRILIEARDSGAPVKVFFDCGGVSFAPPKPAAGTPRREKQLFYAGEWLVEGFRHQNDESARRKVFRFQLKFIGDPKGLELLRYVFIQKGISPEFERRLRIFSKQRLAFYNSAPLIMQSFDSIVSQVGEYFAIKSVNTRCPNDPLLRLRGGFKDIDAVQLSTGKSFAIKSMSGYPAVSSNIWASESELRDRVDNFLIAVFSESRDLVPMFVARMSTATILKLGLLTKAKRQGNVLQLKVGSTFIKHAECIWGEFPSPPRYRESFKPGGGARSRLKASPIPLE